MPLERASGEPSAEIGVVYFPMQDTKTKDRVACSVDYQYLDDRGSLPSTGSQSSYVQLFLTYRSKIEHMASDKYGNGSKAPRITSADL